MAHLQRGNLTFLGQPKVNKVKFVLPFSKFMKRPRTRFNANAMTDSKVIRSKKVKISKFVATQFFFCWSTFHHSYNNRCWHAFASL